MSSIINAKQTLFIKGFFYFSPVLGSVPWIFLFLGLLPLWYRFIYLFLAELGLHRCAGLFSGSASGGCPPGVVCGLLICGGFLAHSSGTRASAAATQLSLSTTQASYPDWRSDLCPLHWQGDS